MKQRILTGIKPSGSIHLGNYIGAIQPIINMQDKGDVYAFIADFHALTTLHTGKNDAKERRKYIQEVASAYIALGVDPKKVFLYKQSDFPQITELTWILACTLNKDYLSIGHAYKDSMQKEKQVGLGVYLYPVLMAADILLPKAQVVPVGEDQKQHIEIARAMAKKFNNLVGKKIFFEPKAQSITSSQVPGIDGRKMSKSYGNTIPIFGSEKEIRDAIAKIKTTSLPMGAPIKKDEIICQYIRLVVSEVAYKQILRRCQKGDIGYKELKDIFFTAYMAYFASARKTYNELLTSEKKVEKILSKHKKTLTKEFDETLCTVKKELGLI